MWSQVRLSSLIRSMGPTRFLPAEEDSSKIPDVSIVESSADLLYGLVHQRFILTKAGLTSMVRHFPLPHLTRLMAHNLRSKSTNKDTLALVLESFVTPPTSYRADAPTCLEQIRSSCSAQIAATSIHLPAANTPVWMVSISSTSLQI